MGAQAYSKPVQEVTSTQDIDDVMGALQARCKEWQALPIKQKVDLLKAVRSRAIKASTKLGEATAKISGFVSEGHPEVIHQDVANFNGLFVGPMIAKTANAYIAQLQEIRIKGKVSAVQVARKTEDGRNVIDRGLWPHKQDVLLKGSRTYVYTQTGKELTQGGDAAAEAAACRDGVAVVLGAGNQPFLAIEDTLYMLFDKHLPVLLKHHPAQVKAAPFWEYVLKPLTDAGFYKGLSADIPLTQHALYHTHTAAVHLTGSDQTYNTILYGPGKEGALRKAANQPRLSVPFTSELGNVTPVFVTPAKWTQEEMKKAAQSITFGTSMNAGCNCIAPKVIVMSAEWSQADEFESVVKAHFSGIPAVPCWYPGSKARYQKFLAAHDSCDIVASTMPKDLTYSAEVLPWAMKSITLTSEKQAAAVLGLQEEFFAPVLIFLRIPGDKAAAASAEAPSATIMRHTDDFLRRIPTFSDTYLWGNLACTLYVPESVKSVMPENVQKCVDNLRYGSVVINNAPFVAYSNHLGAWGGFMSPQSGPGNPGSGLGKLHNFAQIDNVEKQVFEFPWGSTIDFGDTPIPTALVRPLAGLTSDGFRGLWAAVTP